jgi:transitional endoplasmic reticulum ATPase
MTTITSVARDPSWIRACLRMLIPLLPPEKKKEEDAPDPTARLKEPLSDEEHALCAQVEALREQLGLCPLERDLLLLCAALAWTPPLDGLLPELTAPTRSRLLRALARTLQTSPREVRRALAVDGTLAELAHLFLEGERPVYLRLDPECSPMRDLGTPGVRPEDLLAQLLPVGQPASLPLSAHAHLADGVAAARGLLAGALATRARGVHILLWGAPGLGKTELARALAAEAQLVEVETRSRDGSSMSGSERLMSWLNIQRLLEARSGAIVLFDEAEDAIHSLRAAPHRRHAHTSKGSFTRQLETTATPTLWLANDISDLDPAYLRRMTLVLEVRQPPQPVRLALARTLLAPEGVSEPALQALAAHPEVTPALLTQAARALKLTGPSEALPPDRAVLTFLRGHVMAPLALPRPGQRYDPTLIELEGCAPEVLARRLGEAGQGRILLHGPPGTGKSAFARHVAESSGRPLHAHTAAQLLSKFVGESEKQLAHAFQAAAEAGAVLLLDEADALLFTRSAIGASWEGSQVAQALVELERYDGVLVATSNLLPRIDPAFHRRFDLMLEVAEPRPERRQRLVELLADELGLVAPLIGEALVGLVPGHLEQLRRRWRLVGAPTCASGLAAELRRVVGGRKAAMGFAA